mmetsp:Transcript_65470/g.161221  ORF Transcript_65470/g.161221 Transcript_65470/m.161221 type:complete len:330 (-) Transcript_65470:4266-5255(-)
MEASGGHRLQKDVGPLLPRGHLLPQALPRDRVGVHERVRQFVAGAWGGGERAACVCGRGPLGERRGAGLARAQGGAGVGRVQGPRPAGPEQPAADGGTAARHTVRPPPAMDKGRDTARCGSGGAEPLRRRAIAQGEVPRRGRPGDLGQLWGDQRAPRGAGGRGGVGAARVCGAERGGDGVWLRARPGRARRGGLHRGGRPAGELGLRRARGPRAGVRGGEPAHPQHDLAGHAGPRGGRRGHGRGVRVARGARLPSPNCVGRPDQWAALRVRLLLLVEQAHRHSPAALPGLPSVPYRVRAVPCEPVGAGRAHAHVLLVPPRARGRRLWLV